MLRSGSQATRPVTVLVLSRSLPVYPRSHLWRIWYSFSIEVNGGYNSWWDVRVLDNVTNVIACICKITHVVRLNQTASEYFLEPVFPARSRQQSPVICQEIIVSFKKRSSCSVLLFGSLECGSWLVRANHTLHSMQLWARVLYPRIPRNWLTEIWHGASGLLGGVRQLDSDLQDLGRSPLLRKWRCTI